MQSRFALKDFVLLVLLLAVGVSVWLSMVQDDRRWRQGQAVEAKVSALEQQLARVEAGVQRLASGALVPAAPIAPAASAGARSPDDAWARDDGTPVRRFPSPAFAADPTSMPGYRPGGEFSEVFESQMPKVMPFLSLDVYSRRVCDQVFDSLGDYDPVTLDFVGTLAEAWQYDREGRWLRVKIRDTARFSDGEPVKAADVVFTWRNMILDPRIEAARERSIAPAFEDTDGIVEIADRVVEFRYKTPLYSNLTQTLVTYVLPKHFYSRFTPTQINEATGLLLGSGRFKLDVVDPNNQWKPGSDFVIVRNENYWNADKPPLESLRYRTITDDLARLTAFDNGDVDMIRAFEPQHAAKLRDAEWLKRNKALAWVNMRSGYGFIGWQAGKRGDTGKETPFKDARVRLAMTHLIDRERLIEEIYEGIGEVATGPNYSKSPASDPDIVPWPYDLDRAKALLAEAGYADRDGDNILEDAAGQPFRFQFTFAQGSDTTLKVANYLRDQCAKVGIVCEPLLTDWAIFRDIMANRSFDAITLQWSATSPESDPRQIFHSDAIQDQGDNFVQYASPRADDLIDRGVATLDEPARMALWRELHRVLHEEQPYTFMFSRPWIRFVDASFSNVNTYPKGLEQREFFLGGPALPAP